MNDGVELLLKRMETHPQEFEGNGRWERLVATFEEYFTEHEKDRLKAAMYEMRRREFTKRVLEKLVEEPVELDRNTFTFNTAGRDPWGSVTLAHQKAHSDYLDVYEQELQKQIKEEQLKLVAEAYKKEMKNKSPFEKIKGKKYP